jgi:hypothetical protein
VILECQGLWYNQIIIQYRVQWVLLQNQLLGVIQDCQGTTLRIKKIKVLNVAYHHICVHAFIVRLRLSLINKTIHRKLICGVWVVLLVKCVFKIVLVKKNKVQISSPAVIFFLTEHLVFLFRQEMKMVEL